MSKAQLDMFATQEGLLGSEPVVYRADPDRVRRKLERIPAEARAAKSMPWSRSRQGFYRTIFPQMTRWLPEAEAAQYRLDFENEMERLAG